MGSDQGLQDGSPYNPALWANQLSEDWENFDWDADNDDGSDDEEKGTVV